ncbi:PPOX class probable F420-dependent enzyme [Amycolatopsis marina]|uniref:PPOX class probable F420-dependent enzyme n=1 Tax=Amycolatopsis marina TaxID=490629 RepID=A0A1I0VMA4_9PSEU|nr:PPOX class F420-dependent oxidoreductase [Amycolatopsis marina]SFA76716.1 PPOX class probable F420-dependent enzyme [Amycolatopsis marina]
MAQDQALHDLLASRMLSVLVTLKRDGRPQLSNVLHHYDRDAGVVRVSLTDGRAKTKNARRDPRVSLHVSSADGWAYAVAEGTAELSEVARDPQDAAVEELVQLYRDLQGEHPDWDEYRAAMVAEGRLVLRLRVERVYGMAGG